MSERINRPLRAVFERDGRAVGEPLTPEEAAFHVGWHHCSADDAIGLFLEYRDAHGLSETDARVAALVEFDEGMVAHAACGLCGQPPDDSDHGYGGTHNWRESARAAAPAGRDMSETICPRCRHYIHSPHGPRCRDCYGCRTGRAPDAEDVRRG